MLYLLVKAMHGWLLDHGLYSYVSVLDQLQFRALAAAALAFVIVLLWGKRTIAWLTKMKIGDSGLTDASVLQKTASAKANVPTMGGVLIIGAIAGASLLLADLSERYVQLGLIVVLWLAMLGGVDDWLKLTAKLRGTGSRQGLFAWEKLAFQLGLGLLVGYFLFVKPPTAAVPQSFAGRERIEHVLNLPGQKTYIDANRLAPLMPREARDPGNASIQADAPGARTTPTLREPEMVVNPRVWFLSMPIFILIATLMVAGLSNAVNITDGMDGLAGGIAGAISVGVFVLALIAGDQDSATYLLVPHLPGAGEVAVLAGATAGACLGFLWWNCSPAQVFMGDTGALPLGGLLGYAGVALRQEAVVLLMCGVCLWELVSVAMQVGYFKWSKGGRIFRCAPFHHHMQLGGLTEQKAVVRLWIVSVILVVAALASLKVR